MMYRLQNSIFKMKLFKKIRPVRLSIKLLRSSSRKLSKASSLKASSLRDEINLFFSVDEIESSFQEHKFYLSSGSNGSLKLSGK